MSLKLGTTTIAGLSKETTYISNAHQLLDFKWSDHLLNDQNWLRADTFSWQSGDIYTEAYNHLVADIDGITAETETIGSYTVTFYRATDGHKICLADQEQTVLNIYNSYGIAWYYILDTTNTQFKLPRTKYGFEGLRTNVGDMIDESLPNIKGAIIDNYGGLNMQNTGCFTGAVGNATNYNAGSSQTVKYTTTSFAASNSSSTYQDNAPVQERATQMYLYFYVGDYSQSAIEQTAGLNSELFNGKADVNLSNCTKPHIVETYVNGTSWYRVYSDGWCEQGGMETTKSAAQRSVSFLKTFSNTSYSVLLCYQSSDGDLSNGALTTRTKNTGSFTFYAWSADEICWQASGYIR